MVITADIKVAGWSSTLNAYLVEFKIVSIKKNFVKNTPFVEKLCYKMGLGYTVNSQRVACPVRLAQPIITFQQKVHY